MAKADAKTALEYLERATPTITTDVEAEYRKRHREALARARALRRNK